MLACPQCKLRYPNGKARCWLDGAPLVELQDPRIGTTLGGRYVIEEVIGEGGMATVYRGRHKLVDRPCAIKIINDNCARDDVLCERFRREARSAQKLAHPNIIEIFDQGELPERGVYLVMELLIGQSLASLLDSGRVDWGRGLPIAIQIARALARAHDLDVIHRDLKPDNIFVTAGTRDEDLVKLLDFGIARSMQDARLTNSGEVFGTPEYIAPERIRSSDAGGSQDLYALGVILFELFTGTLPFVAKDVTEYFLKHLNEPAPDPRTRDANVPEPLALLVRSLLAKSPGERPVDAHRVYNDLCQIAGAIGIRVPPEQTTESPSGRAPAKTLPPVQLDAWAHRTALFQRMLSSAYGNQPPAEQARLLAEVQQLIGQIATLRGRALEQQRLLLTVEEKGREARTRLGTAVEALGNDLSAARDEQRGALAAQFALITQAEVSQERMRRAQSEVKDWEQRTASGEPKTELATAYRRAADAVDAWCRMFGKVQAADGRATRAKAKVEDLEFQVGQLRQVLGQHEAKMDQESAQGQLELAELGAKADELEDSLLTLASQFCDPLRRRADMLPFFHELEGSAGTSSPVPLAQ